MRFKTVDMHKQFSELCDKNGKLANISRILDQYCSVEFNKDVCITHVFRTPEEHTALYSQTVESQRPKSSPHMFWKAVDIRSTDFTEAQRKKMLTFLNCFTYASGQGKPVAMVHAIAGNALHFHIQAD